MLYRDVFRDRHRLARLVRAPDTNRFIGLRTNVGRHLVHKGDVVVRKGGIVFIRAYRHFGGREPRQELVPYGLDSRNGVWVGQIEVVRRARLHELRLPLVDHERVTGRIDFRDDRDPVARTRRLHLEKLLLRPALVLPRHEALECGPRGRAKSKRRVEVLPPLVALAVQEGRVPEVVRRVEVHLVQLEKRRIYAEVACGTASGERHYPIDAERGDLTQKRGLKPVSPSVQHKSAYLPSRRVVPLACGERHGVRTLRQTDRGLLEESPGAPPNTEGGRRRDHVGVVSNLKTVPFFRWPPIVKIELRRWVEGQVYCWNGGCVIGDGSREQDGSEGHVGHRFLQVVSECFCEIEEGRVSLISIVDIDGYLHGR